MNRREFLEAGAMIGSYSPAKAALAAPTYESLAQEVWAPIAGTGNLTEIVRAATLAANSHNAQAWAFALGPNSIRILPDTTRRCPVVDPDDHHLFVSLGCAAENVALAAAAAGLHASLTVEPQGSINIAFSSAKPLASPLAAAITNRQCTRSDYDGKPLAPAELDQLAAAARVAGAEVDLITERTAIEAILEYAMAGSDAQLRDAAFVAELTSWLRFNDTDAIASRDGLASRCSGNPSLPAWLARPLLSFFMTESGERDKLARHVRSSAGLAVFSSAGASKVDWIAVGRSYQRFALQATALGVKQAFVNQPAEVPAIRGQLAAHLGIGARRPDLILRFGRGPSMPRALRRPVADVIRSA